MKILFLNPIAAVGGAERVLLTMVEMLRKHRPEIEIAVLTIGDGPLLDRLRELGATTESLAAPAAVTRVGDSGLGLLGKTRTLLNAIAALPGLWRLRRDFRRAVQRIAPDIVHSNGIKMHLLTSLARLGAIPVVWHIHDFIGSRPIARTLLKHASRRMTEAIAISQAVADDFRGVVGPRPVTLILNAVDLSRFRPGLPRDGLPDGDDCLRVGIVATYARWKGQEVFLEAAARVARNLPKLPVKFYVIGGPVYQTSGSQYNRHDLQTRVENLGISDRTEIIGFQGQVERVYSSLDVVVHASTKPEPFGLTIVEAMACGRSVIAARAGGVGEIITDGVDAIGVPPGDSEALAYAMQVLLQDESLRESLGVNARSTAERLFDQNRVGLQLFAVYDRLRRKSM